MTSAAEAATNTLNTPSSATHLPSAVSKYPTAYLSSATRKCFVSPASNSTFSNATSSFSGRGSRDFSSVTYTCTVSHPLTSPTLLTATTSSSGAPSAERTRPLRDGRPYSKVV